MNFGGSNMILAIQYHAVEMLLCKRYFGLFLDSDWYPRGPKCVIQHHLGWVWVSIEAGAT